MRKCKNRARIMANLKIGRGVELALDAKATLGEGPVWHIRRKKLYWVSVWTGPA